MGGSQAHWALERAPRRADPEGEGCGCPQKGPRSREGCRREPQRAGWGWARLAEALGQALGPPCREWPHPWGSSACPGGHGDPHGQPSPRTATVPGREPPGTRLQGHRAVRGPQPPSQLRATGTRGSGGSAESLGRRGCTAHVHFGPGHQVRPALAGVEWDNVPDTGKPLGAVAGAVVLRGNRRAGLQHSLPAGPGARQSGAALARPVKVQEKSAD